MARPAAEVVTANPGCAMQLRSSLRRSGANVRVSYVVEVLAEAYGGPRAKPVVVEPTTRDGEDG